MATSIFIPPSIWKPARWPEKTDSFVGTSPQQLSRSKLEKKKTTGLRRKNEGIGCLAALELEHKGQIVHPESHLKTQGFVSCFIIKMNKIIFRWYENTFFWYFLITSGKKKGMCVDVTHHSQRGLKAAFLTSATSRREVLVRSNSRYRSIEHMLA
jgi:hypothetical protein